MSELTANTGDLNASFCATLVDEWAAHGITRAVIAPGSRSTPLAIALARNSRIQVSVVLDERTAAFRALGIAKATGLPAVVVCTSGSAGAHFAPAIVEADHGRVPMIVCTADRPPELRDTGAGQTIDQVHLYGRSVRWFVDPGPPDGHRPEYWRSIAARSVSESVGALGRGAGPVHCNLAFREPFTGNATLAAGRGVVSGTVQEPTSARVELTAELVARLRSSRRGLIVVGWGSALTESETEQLSIATGWPVLADAISGVRSGTRSIGSYEAIVRDEVATQLRPEIVVRFGAAPTSKVLTTWLDATIEHVVVDPNNVWLDPLRAASWRLEINDDVAARSIGAAVAGPRGNVRWFEAWKAADTVAREAIADRFAQLDVGTDLDGARIARTVWASLPDNTHVLVASSMAVRDLDWFAEPRSGVRIHANRGVNGIDGLIATAAGIALATAQKTVAIIGDLAFLHDAGSLLGIAQLSIDLTVLIVDNNGGGIFSFLPQADDCRETEFEDLFGTPQSADLVAIAQSYGHPTTTVASAAELRAALVASESTSGVRVIIAATVDRTTEVARHRDIWSAVAQRNIAATIAGLGH